MYDKRRYIHSGAAARRFLGTYVYRCLQCNLCKIVSWTGLLAILTSANRLPVENKLKKLRVLRVLAGSVLAVISVNSVQAQTWAEQQAYNRERTRQALQQQAQQGYSPQVQQGMRWENEWRQQHPGQPMPSFGALEKMHRSETMQNMNAGFDRMRQNRQREL